MAAAAVEHGEDLLTPGITLSWNGGKGELDQGDLLEALTIRTHAPGRTSRSFSAWTRNSCVKTWANTPPASISWRETHVGASPMASSNWQVPDMTGRGLDLDSGVETVTKAFLSGTPRRR